MYEIYINDRPLRLISSSDLDQHQSQHPLHLLARYSGKIKTLLNYADLLEKGSPKVSAVTLYYPDLDQLWEDFLMHYKIVTAAGGIVQLAETDQYLFIFRRGYLDLPKGKVDKGETIEQAAIREVQEETGLQNVELVPQKTGELKIENQESRIKTAAGSSAANQESRRPLPLTTLHTYRNRKEKRVLKPTYWFPMMTTQKELIPETEEDIEWARWLSFKNAQSGNWPFYESLLSLVQRFSSNSIK